MLLLVLHGTQQRPAIETQHLVHCARHIPRDMHAWNSAAMYRRVSSLGRQSAVTASTVIDWDWFVQALLLQLLARNEECGKRNVVHDMRRLAHEVAVAVQVSVGA